MGKENKIGIGKFWGWQLRGVSMGCMVIILGYLSIYATDTLLVPASIVGTLLLCSKLFDGVTDLVAGFIIDNTHTKLGKARPYEFAIIGVWLGTWLLYSCQESWSLTVKCIWIFVMYTFVNSIFATFMYANQTPYMLRAFPNQQLMVKLNSYGGIIVTIGCAIVSMSFPQLMATMATSGAGWSKLVGIFALPLLVIGLMRFVLVKEEVDVDEGEDSKINFTDMKTALTTNKYIYMVCGITLLYNIVIGLNSYTYYFTYIGGGIDRYTALAAISMPLLVVMFIFPVVMKKGVPISRIILFGACCGAVGWGMNFIAGDNLGILIAAAVLYTFAGLPIAYISGMMILDCAEYNTLIGNKRMEGTLSAIGNLGSKVGQGIGAGLLGVLLSAFGYVEGAAAQSDGALIGIKCLYSVIPAIGYVLIAVICLVYNLDKVLIKLRAEKAA